MKYSSEKRKAEQKMQPNMNISTACFIDKSGWKDNKTPVKKPDGIIDITDINSSRRTNKSIS
ncbi:hypothetical protein YDYSY3_38130 [Paenibacillus chitinolyticus]|nr:hypothetical protein YDYSY3_38130 [Paenibacillus chitinolyticus]